MLFRSSLAFRVQVWLIARVAKNRMHQYKQESKCIISRRSNTHGRDEIAVIKLHIYAGKRLKWMTSIKLLAITSHLSSAWNMELYSKISATGVCSLKDKLKLHRTLQQFTI